MHSENRSEVEFRQTVDYYRVTTIKITIINIKHDQLYSHPIAEYDLSLINHK